MLASSGGKSALDYITRRRGGRNFLADWLVEGAVLHRAGADMRLCLGCAVVLRRPRMPHRH